MNLKRLREAAGLSQVELAESVGTHSPTISDWENEKKHNDPLLSTLIRLSGPLRCAPANLIATDAAAAGVPSLSLAADWAQLSASDQRLVVDLIARLLGAPAKREEFQEWDGKTDRRKVASSGTS